MFAPKLKNTPAFISLLLIMTSGIIGSSAHAEVYKCKVDGKIEYRAKKCAKGSERDITVPIVTPKVPDHQAIKAQQQAEQQAKQVIEKYIDQLSFQQNLVRRQQNKLNELSRNREEALSLLKRRAQRLGSDEQSQQLRYDIGKQINSTQKHYNQQINIARENLKSASKQLKVFLQQPKPEGYEKYMEAKNDTNAQDGRQ